MVYYYFFNWSQKKIFNKRVKKEEGVEFTNDMGNFMKECSNIILEDYSFSVQLK